MQSACSVRYGGCFDLPWVNSAHPTSQRRKAHVWKSLGRGWIRDRLCCFVQHHRPASLSRPIDRDGNKNIAGEKAVEVSTMLRAGGVRADNRHDKFEPRKHGLPAQVKYTVLPTLPASP